MTVIEYVPYIVGVIGLVGMFVRLGASEGRLRTKQDGIITRLRKVEEILDPPNQNYSFITIERCDNFQKACKMQIRTELEASQNKILGEIGQIRTLIEEHTRPSTEIDLRAFNETMRQVQLTLKSLK